MTERDTLEEIKEGQETTKTHSYSKSADIQSQLQLIIVESSVLQNPEQRADITIFKSDSRSEGSEADQEALKRLAKKLDFH